MSTSKPSWFHTFFFFADRSIRQLLIMLIVGIRPLLGPPCNCRYYVSCTDFAVYHLENEPQLHRALWLIFKRVASCHPFHRRKKS